MSGYMYDCAGFTIPLQARFRCARHAAPSTGGLTAPESDIAKPLQSDRPGIS